jgi:serine/threonine-protein phosphatase 6 regulatory ankyrin repeat subunit A
MDDSSQPQPCTPKRNSRMRRVVLLATLGVVTTIYLPVRAGRANDRLMHTVMTGELEGVRAALDSGADPDLTLNFSKESEPIRGVRDLVRFLYHHSLRPPPNNAETALMWAARNSRTDIVTELLRHGANVNRHRDSGETALLYAAYNSSSETLAALLAGGASTQAHDQYGQTPLLAAARGGRTQNVRLLLEKGADIHVMDRNSQTALSLATENHSEETIRFLLAHGADARDLQAARLNPSSPTVRFLTTGSGRNLLTVNGVTTVVPGGQQPQLRPQDRPALPPLVFAAKYGSLALLKFLWEQSDADTKSQYAWSVLCNATASGQIEAVRFLLDQHLSVNPPNTEGLGFTGSVHLIDGYDPRRVYTPLHYAAALPTPEIARLLIEHGADVNAQDAFGTTPLLAAAGGFHLANVRLLIEHGANVRAAETISGQTALQRCLYDVTIARLLITHGLNVNARDRTGKTALMQCPTPQSATLLLEHGADVDARDNMGRTALMRCSSSQVAEVLIAHGAAIDARDNQGNTPLLMAARTAQTELAALLLKKGANVHLVNNQGETPLFAARATRFQPMIDLISATGVQR